MKLDVEHEKHIVRSERTEEISDVARANIEELLANPDRKIDTSDIPEWTDEHWKDAVRGRFYRPRKEAVSLRLDADVLAWLKKDGQGYQTRVNQIQREMMRKDLGLTKQSASVAESRLKGRRSAQGEHQSSPTLCLCVLANR